MAKLKTLILLGASALLYTPSALVQTSSGDAPVEAVETTLQTAAVRSPDMISTAAAVYGMFQGDVGDIKTNPLSSAGDIDTALNNLGGQNAAELSKGWLAYSALVASQSEEFRAAVKDIEGFYGRDRVLTGFRNDITYARKLDGGAPAIRAAMTAIDADSRRIDSAADFVKEQAYSLQSAGWAKARFNNPSKRADRLNAAAKVGRSVEPKFVTALSSEDAQVAFSSAGAVGSPSLWDGMSVAAASIRFPSFASVTGGQKKDVRAGRELVADRIATLAAYRVMGIDGAASTQVEAALADRSSKACLTAAQLNLQQCVAASYKQYEVPFCIGQHALSEVSACIDDVVQ